MKGNTHDFKHSIMEFYIILQTMGFMELFQHPLKILKTVSVFFHQEVTQSVIGILRVIHPRTLHPLHVLQCRHQFVSRSVSLDS